MFGRYSRIPLAAAMALLCGLSDSFAAEDDRPSDVAEAILQASGVQGGLVVHLNCGPGKITAALCANDRYIVQGLSRDPQSIEAARKHIESTGLYGQASVRLWDGKQLPYGDNLVNLLVVGSLLSVDDAEILRILRPGGVAIQLDPETRNLKPYAQ